MNIAVNHRPLFSPFSLSFRTQYRTYSTFCNSRLLLQWRLKRGSRSIEAQLTHLSATPTLLADGADVFSSTVPHESL